MLEEPRNNYSGGGGLTGGTHEGGNRRQARFGSLIFQLGL
jgi:hypothetical protein